MPQGIVIVGLGPGNPQHLTVEAQQVLAGARELYLRTAKHPTVAHLPPHLALHAFDHVYEAHDSFDAVYAEIVRQVLALARRPEGVIYAVPGHPLVGEATVRRLLEEAEQAVLPVRIVAGLSFVEPVLTALRLDPLDGLQLLDALELAASHYPPLDPDRPALIGQLYSRALASDVKLALMNAYPDEHPVTLAIAAGTDAERLITLPLYELDRRQEVDYLTTLYVPPLPQAGSMGALLEVVGHLRAPDGCPWDREQTHLSLRQYLLEETYEVLAALDAEDPAALCEELGDLLLQIVLHAQVALEEGEFKWPDVLQHIVAKLRRRHPHVFGEVQVSGAAEVLVNWDRIKREEQRDEPAAAAHSLLAKVPAALPALARAQAMQERAARVGFDWRDVAGVITKVREEVAELQAAADEARFAELGDLLFALVNLARWLGIDAEAALRAATARFAARFQEMERLAAARGVELGDLPLAAQDALWEEAKRRERADTP